MQINGGDVRLANVSSGTRTDVRAAIALSAGDMNSAGLISLQSSGGLATGNLVTLGNVAPGALAIDVGAAGSATLGSVASGAGGLRLVAGGGVQANALSSGGALVVQGNGVTLGAVTAGARIDLLSAAALAVGAVRGDQNVKISGGGAITAATVSAGNSIEISFEGAAGTLANITTGNLDAGIVGASASPLAGYQIGVSTGAGSITTGTITARGNVGLLSRTGAIATGAVATDRDFVVLAHTGITTGGIVIGGTALLADAAMADLLPISLDALAPPPGFDFAPIFAATPVGLAGDILSLGAVSAGGLRAAALGTVTFGSITTTGSVLLAGGTLALAGLAAGGDLNLASDSALVIGAATAGGDIAIASGGDVGTGALIAGGSADISGRNIATAAIRAGNDIDLASTGDLTTTTLSAGDSVFLRAANGQSAGQQPSLPLISTGAIDAGIVAPFAGPGSAYGVYVDSVGNTALGNITAAGAIGVIAQGGALVTGNLVAGTTVVLLDGLGVTTGAITTPLTGGVYFGSHLQAPLIRFDGAGNPDYAALFAVRPTRLAGDIVIGGPVVTGDFAAAATGQFSSGNISAARSLYIDAARLALGNIAAGIDVDLIADADILAGTIRAGRDARLTAGGRISTGAISVGDRLFLRSGGRVDTGAIDAGLVDPAAGGRGLVFVDAGGDAALGDVSAASSAGVVSAGRIDIGTVSTGTQIVLLAANGVTSGTLATPLDGGVFIESDSQKGLIGFDRNGNPDYAPLFAANPVRLNGDIIINGDVTTGVFKAATSGRIVISGNVTAALGSILNADSQVLGDLTLGGPLLLTVDSALTIGNIIAAGAVALTSLGDLTTGSIMAGGVVAITARAGADGIGDVVLGNVRSEADIRVSAVGNITAGDLSAANSIFLRATTPVTTGIAPIIKTGNIDTGIINPSNAPGDNYLLFVDSTGTTDVGDVTARGSIGIIAQGGSLITGDLVAGTSITLLDGLGITTGAITTPAAGGVFISSHLQAPLISFDLPGNPDYAALFAATPMRLVGDLSITGPVNTGLFKAAATGTVTIAALTAANDIYIDGAALVLGRIIAGANLELISDSALNLGNLRAGGDIDLTSGGLLTTGTLSAGDSVNLIAAGVTTQAISAGTTAASIDPLAQYGVGVRSRGAIAIAGITARGPVGLAALGSSISVGAITTGESLALLARSGVSAGSIRTASNGLTLIAADTMAALVTEDANGNANYTGLVTATPVALAGPVALGGTIDTGALRIATTGTVMGSAAINAAGAVTIRSGSLALGAINAGGALDIRGTGTLMLGALRGEGDIGLEAGNTITIAAISAGDSVAIGFGAAAVAGASLTTGAIDAGILRASQSQGAAYQIGIGGLGAVTTGAINARGNIGIRSATGSISSGAISTTASFAGLAATGFTGTSIATGTQGSLLIANASMFTAFADRLDALGPASGFDFAPLFALAPVRIGGPVTLTGTASTGRFVAAASGAVTLAGISAGTAANIDSGALASFTGAVSAPTITVTSADIAIGAAFGTGATSAVNLNIASNASAITIGGSADSANGYVLGSAEAGRITATTLTVAALGSQPQTMTVQALNFAGSGLASKGRTLSLTTGGIIRVNGALALTGAGAGDTLRLQAGQRIEVATDGGGKISGTASGDGANGALGGFIDLAAANIWFGSSALLGQLATDVGFAGRDAALATAAATPDLAGALAADRIVVSARASFLIQNSGSLAQKAGFSAGTGSFTIRPSGTTPLDLVVNGRAQDSAGTFQTNQKTIDVIRFASASDSPAGFTATSTVNGCIVGNICGLAPEEGGMAVANIVTNLQGLIENTAETPEEQEEEARQAADKLPQMRISRLVDLSSAIEDVSITEPVTGGGNPALWLDLPAGGGVQP